MTSGENGNTGSARRVMLVGHCGPDMFMLKGAVGRYLPGLMVESVNESAALQDAGGETLLLVNRVLDGRFGTESGVELIRELHERDDPPRMILISNYPEAQAEAVAAGARPGFGKRELYDATTGERLRAALDAE